MVAIPYPSNFCCCTYLSYCHRATSNIYWTTRTHFIAMTTGIACLEESADFPVIPCSGGFLEFLSTKFVAGSKPPSRDNHRNESYPSTQPGDQGAY